MAHFDGLYLFSIWSFCRQILLASEIMVFLGILFSFNVIFPYTEPQYICSGLLMFVSAEVLEGKILLVISSICFPIYDGVDAHESWYYVSPSKTRNELKVSNLNTYRLKNEERTKNGEERRKIFTDWLTETSRKRYESTSAWIFFTETSFSSTQNSWSIVSYPNFVRGIRDS